MVNEMTPQEKYDRAQALLARYDEFGNPKPKAPSLPTPPPPTSVTDVDKTMRKGSRVDRDTMQQAIDASRISGSDDARVQQIRDEVGRVDTSPSTLASVWGKARSIGGKVIDKTFDVLDLPAEGIERSVGMLWFNEVPLAERWRAGHMAYDSIYRDVFRGDYTRDDITDMLITNGGDMSAVNEKYTKELANTIGHFALDPMWLIGGAPLIWRLLPEASAAQKAVRFGVDFSKLPVLKDIPIVSKLGSRPIDDVIRQVNEQAWLNSEGPILAARGNGFLRTLTDLNPAGRASEDLSELVSFAHTISTRPSLWLDGAGDGVLETVKDVLTKDSARAYVSAKFDDVARSRPFQRVAGMAQEGSFDVERLGDMATSSLLPTPTLIERWNNMPAAVRTEGFWKGLSQLRTDDGAALIIDKMAAGERLSGAEQVKYANYRSGMLINDLVEKARGPVYDFHVTGYPKWMQTTEKFTAMTKSYMGLTMINNPAFVATNYISNMTTMLIRGETVSGAVGLMRPFGKNKAALAFADAAGLDKAAIDAMALQSTQISEVIPELSIINGIGVREKRSTAATIRGLMDKFAPFVKMADRFDVAMRHTAATVGYQRGAEAAAPHLAEMFAAQLPDDLRAVPGLLDAVEHIFTKGTVADMVDFTAKVRQAARIPKSSLQYMRHAGIPPTAVGVENALEAATDLLNTGGGVSDAMRLFDDTVNQWMIENVIKHGVDIPLPAISEAEALRPMPWQDAVEWDSIIGAVNTAITTRVRALGGSEDIINALPDVDWVALARETDPRVVSDALKNIGTWAGAVGTNTGEQFEFVSELMAAIRTGLDMRATADEFGDAAITLAQARATAMRNITEVMNEHYFDRPAGWVKAGMKAETPGFTDQIAQSVEHTAQYISNARAALLDVTAHAETLDPAAVAGLAKYLKREPGTGALSGVGTSIAGGTGRMYGQGRFNIVEGIKAEAAAGRISREAEVISTAFVENIPAKYLQELRSYYMQDGPPLLNGEYTPLGFFNGVAEASISIYNKAMERGGRTTTIAHEVAHHINTFLSPREQELINAAYLAERTALAAGDTGGARAYSPTAYRWANSGEWFAERFVDRSLLDIQRRANPELRNALEKAHALAIAWMRSIAEYLTSIGKTDIIDDVYKNVMNGTYSSAGNHNPWLSTGGSAVITRMGMGAPVVEHTLEELMSMRELIASKVGTGWTNVVGLNYDRKYGIDTLLQLALPYEFWTTRTGAHWARMALARPGYTAAFAHLYQTIADINEDAGIPDRLKHNIRIPIPFLDHALGGQNGSIFIDPLRTIIPFTNYLNSPEQPDDDHTGLGKVVDFARQFAPGGVSPFMTLGLGATGLLGDRDTYVRSSLAGLTKSLGPVPGPRVVRALSEYYMGLADKPDPLLLEDGLLAQIQSGQPMPQSVLEQIFKETFDTVSTDGFDAFRIDRTISNLVGEDPRRYTPAAGLAALLTRSGPLYDEAKRLAGKEKGLRILSGWLAMPLSIYPEGESVQKGLDAIYREMGDDASVTPAQRTAFFASHPEYQVRRAAMNPTTRVEDIETEYFYNDLAAMEAKYVKPVEQLRKTRRLMEESGALLTKEGRRRVDIVEGDISLLLSAQDRESDNLEALYPHRKEGISVLASPRERALASLRNEYFNIRRQDFKTNDEFFAARRTFITTIPDKVPAADGLWYALASGSIAEQALASERIDKTQGAGISREIERRDRVLNALMAEASKRITQKDFTTYLSGSKEPPTAARMEYQQAVSEITTYAAYSKITTLTPAQQRAAKKQYWETHPLLQKYYGADEPDPWSAEVAATFEKMDDIWAGYYEYQSDARAQREYLASNLDRLNAYRRAVRLPALQLTNWEPLLPGSLTGRVPSSLTQAYLNDLTSGSR